MDTDYFNLSCRKQLENFHLRSYFNSIAKSNTKSVEKKMKFVRKLLFVLLMCGLLLPVYAAKKSDKKQAKATSIECPNCGKKVKLDKKKDKKKKKKSKKKSKKDKKNKKGQSAENAKTEKQGEPTKITCPKCKKDIPLPGAKKAEDKKDSKEEDKTADSAENTPADAEDTGTENTGAEAGNTGAETENTGE